MKNQWLKLILRHLHQGSHLLQSSYFPIKFDKLPLQHKQFGKDISFIECQMISFSDSDAISFKSCKEMEEPYRDYVERQFKKPVFLEGPIVREPPTIVFATPRTQL